MKSFDLSTAVLPASLAPVASDSLIAILSSSGSTAFRFHAGDVVEFTETVLSRTREGSDKKVRVIPYLGCFRNGKQTAIPFSAFRDLPAFETEAERETFLSKSPVMQALADCSSDLERFEYLKSLETVKVLELVSGRARDWKTSPAGTPPAEVKYIQRSFAVLAKQ